MEFGWVNIFGAVFAILMLIPNIVYAINNKGEKNLCTNRFMNLIEQIGASGRRISYQFRILLVLSHCNRRDCSFVG